MPRRAHSTVAHTPLVPLASALRGGSLPLERALTEILDRVERLEPTLRALLPEDGRAERLRAEARDLEARYPEPASRPPLFGVLLGVKDIIAVDGMPTRAGSALPPEAFAMPEATIVSRLRAAGALVLGKTVTAQFASAGPGATTNPHDSTRTPGGSSSGSVAGVAAGYTPLALGSQTGGSVIRPAAYCGIVGFKPSYGRIPIDGVLYHAPSVDTLGLFTQDIEGIALAASVVVDDWREAEPRPAHVLGVPDGPYLSIADAAALEVFETTLRQLQDAGVQVKRMTFLEDVAEVEARHLRLMAAEFAQVHADYFARWGALYGGTEAGHYDEGLRVTAEEHQTAVEGRLELRERVTRALDAAGVDAFVCPAATGPAPRTLRSTGSPSMNAPWTHAGVPALTLPAGELEGMPLGLQLVGAFGRDEELVATASALAPLL